MIELINVSKQFHHKNKLVTALSDVSLSIPKGKVFGVIGASGAGKSTLIRCVNLLERPTTGQVLIEGKDLLKLTPSELAMERRQMGMIFQHFNLLSSRTVAQNIAFPLELAGLSKSAITERVEELLKLVGLEEKHNDYPATLSGGQKQRVAIARTLATNPKVLLCDEATSALDPATTKAILHLLKDINKRLHITILLITHEMDVVKSICDEVAVISAGKLVEQGTVSDLFSHPKTSLAKEFVASAIKIELPESYKDRLTSEQTGSARPLIKLDFTGLSVDDPVLSEVSRLYGVDNNIVYAQIENVGGVKFGAMVVEVISAAADHQRAMEYYAKKNINVEVLGYV